MTASSKSSFNSFHSSPLRFVPPLAALLLSSGLNLFADRVPNGHLVPNPYPQGGVWAGVGHAKAGGGGVLNPFGEDFRAQGLVWTTDLCGMDSDGDGRSNGVELGDPNCVWTEGDEPDLPALSHPGIVDEPQDEAATTSCSDYEEPEENVKYDIQFGSPAQVGSERTHYVCEQKMMAVPSAEKLHKIKSRVLLDNAAILHHMFVYICFDGTTTDGNDQVGQGPYTCDGAESVCTIVGNWAIGPEEECLPPTVGTEFDFTGMEQVLIKVEAHYDNTLGVPQQDQSGIQVTFTPILRPLSSGMTAWGMDVINKDFVIPARQESVSLTSICPSEATARLDHPLYVFQFYPHMHLLGRSMVTEHYRCGQKIGTVGNVQSYEFDNQQQYRMMAKILPGDALVTTCEYNNANGNETIYSGLGTDDEMCVGFMTFYPKLENNDLLQACFSFENGIALDRVTLPAAGGGGEDVEAPDPSLVATLLNGRFVITSSNPTSGFLFNFSSDPTSSWAPCCETNSCDVAYLADQGEACAVDADCTNAFVCMDGLCDIKSSDTPVDSTDEGDPPDGTDASVGVHWMLSRATFLLSLFMVGVLA